MAEGTVLEKGPFSWSSYDCHAKNGWSWHIVKNRQQSRRYRRVLITSILGGRPAASKSREPRGMSLSRSDRRSVRGNLYRTYRAASSGITTVRDRPITFNACMWPTSDADDSIVVRPKAVSHVRAHPRVAL